MNTNESLEHVVCTGFTQAVGTGKVLKAEPEAIQLAAEQTALIVIDMQNAYTSKGGYLDLAGFDVSKTKPVVENIKKAVSFTQDVTCKKCLCKNLSIVLFSNSGSVCVEA